MLVRVVRASQVLLQTVDCVLSTSTDAPAKLLCPTRSTTVPIRLAGTITNRSTAKPSRRSRIFCRPRNRRPPPGQPDDHLFFIPAHVRSFQDSRAVRVTNHIESAILFGVWHKSGRAPSG